ncbi:MAG: hypothetical protein M3Y42_00915 [Actinomycetota bacterium]|nr:hypothetical protein [Actinomycetota bacterium]
MHQQFGTTTPALWAAASKSSSSSDYWQLVLTIATITGGLAAIQQFYRTVRRRRQDAALTNLLGALADSTDAEAAKAELEEIRLALETSKRALADDVPRQARVLFLENRRQALVDGIAADYELLISTTRELDGLSSASLSVMPDLPANVRAAIHALLPTARQLRRENRIMVILLGLLVASVVLPTSPSALVHDYFNVVSDGSYYTQSSVWQATLAAAVVVGMVLYWPSRWVNARLRGWRRTATIVAICVIAAGGIAGFGYLLQDSLDMVDPYYEDSGLDGQIETYALLLTAAIGTFFAAWFPPLVARIRDQWRIVRRERRGHPHP